MVAFRHVYTHKDWEGAHACRLKLAKEASALWDNWNEWEELCWLSLTAKKNKGFKPTNSDNRSPPRSAICPDRSVGVTLFYHFCLGTVLRAWVLRDRENKKHRIWWCVCVWKLNSPTTLPAPFPISLDPSTSSRTSNTLISKSCFWTRVGPPSQVPSLTVMRFIWEKFVCFLPTCLYMITSVFSFASACVMWQIQRMLLSPAAVYKVFRAPVCASVYLPEPLTTQSKCWDIAAGLFTLTICRFLTRLALSTSNEKHSHAHTNRNTPRHMHMLIRAVQKSLKRPHSHAALFTVTPSPNDSFNFKTERLPNWFNLNKTIFFVLFSICKINHGLKTAAVICDYWKHHRECNFLVIFSSQGYMFSYCETLDEGC